MFERAPLAHTKSKEELHMELNFKIEWPEVADGIILTLLQKDFEELDLDEDDRQAFLEVIQFYTTEKEFRDWYENLD